MENPPLLNCWDDILALYQRYSEANSTGEISKLWIFRGAESEKYELSPVLEREVWRFEENLSRMREHETKLLQEFKRQYHQHVSTLPHPDDDYRWLALLRHHFGPTRVLDFTYSFWVALYFAVENARPGCHCVLWAIDHDALFRSTWERLPKKLRQVYCEDDKAGKQPSTAKLFLETNVDAIWPFNPFDLDYRLSVQQGLFLMPMSLDDKFDAIIKRQCSDRSWVVKHPISVTKELLRKCLTELNNMNVNRRSLFPGLDGFAYGLRHRIAWRYLNLRDEKCNDTA